MIRRRSVPSPTRQSGMALLAVLLLSVVMGVLVMAMLDDIRFGVQRTTNAQAIAQAQRFALGAEAMARARVTRLGDHGIDINRWNGKPLLFPVEDGIIHARLRDGSTCFNLNSVASGVPGQWTRNEPGLRHYVALLAALDFPAAQAQALADALADWIDSDGVRGPLGAEDATYAARLPAYRTAGTLLAEVSELHAIQGYSAPVYERLRPYVCALPIGGQSPVNVNALTLEQAPILSMLTLGGLDRGRARQLIASRPVEGWSELAFFAAVSSLQLQQEATDQIQVRSRWFVLDVDVDHAGAQATLNALLEYNGMGDARLAARRWTRDE